jgi:hypothetical protein
VVEQVPSLAEPAPLTGEQLPFVAAEQAPPSFVGRRQSLPAEPMKASAVDGPTVVTDGRFEALRKLHALRVDGWKQPGEEELDVPVEVELMPFELSAVAPNVASVEALDMAAVAPAGFSELASAPQESAPAFLDTTPTHVMTRVVPRLPEAQLNLVAPTPVSSVASTPLLAMAVDAAVPSDDVVPDLDDAVAPEASHQHQLPDQDDASSSDMSEMSAEIAPSEVIHCSPSEAPHRPSDVNDLLARFATAPRGSDRELLRGLERLAGVDPLRGGPARLEGDTEERLRPNSVVAVR